MSEQPQTSSRAGLLQFVSQAWLVILLALLFGTALAAVELALKPRILENKRQKTLRQVPILFSKFENPQAEALTIEPEPGKPTQILRVTSNGVLIGWVLPGNGPGFADKIDLLVAVNANYENVVGISILKQSETPGLGDYITKKTEPLRQGFASGQLVTTSNIKVRKQAENPDPGRNEVQAISGATISSESVTKIVNQTLNLYRDNIPQGDQNHGTP